jgi:hypothetical protein
MSTQATTSRVGNVAGVRRLFKGDVVRVHTDGLPNGTGQEEKFILIRVGD